MKVTKQSIFLTFLMFFLILPFVSFQWQFDGYEFPKYLLVSIVGILSGIWLLFQKEVEIPNIYICLYFIFFVISSLFSENFLHSFYGDYPRLNQNILLFISIFLIGVVFINNFPKTNLLKLVFLSSLGLSLVTFFEKSERVISTLGQPNYLGIILVLGIIYSIKKSEEKKVYLLATCFLLISLFLTASITLLATLLIYLLYLLITSWKKYYKYFFLFLIIFLVLTFINPTSFQKIEDNIYLLTNPSNVKITDSILVRIEIWRDSLQITTLTLKNFLIGTGPETFSLNYEKYRGNGINFTSEWNSLIDKPHNYFLEVLIEQGIIGLLTFILLLILAFKHGDKDYKKYILVITIFLFFNWPHIYLQLIIFLLLFQNLKIKEDNQNLIKNNLQIKITILFYILICMYSFMFYRFDEMERIDTITNNPYIIMSNLNQINSKDEAVYQTKFIHENYPNNLKFIYESYLIEKKFNLPSQTHTLEKIKILRPDLIEWHPNLQK